ncbi:hypothetical protein PG988_004056 [Apiospora saccharicola]
MEGFNRVQPTGLQDNGLPGRTAGLAGHIHRKAMGNFKSHWVHKDYGVISVANDVVMIVHDNGDPSDTSYHIVTGFGDFRKGNMTPEQIQSAKKGIKAKRFGLPKPMVKTLLKDSVCIDDPEERRQHIKQVFHNNNHNEFIAKETEKYLDNLPDIEFIRQSASDYVQARTGGQVFIVPNDTSDRWRPRIRHGEDDGYASDFTWSERSPSPTPSDESHRSDAQSQQDQPQDSTRGPQDQGQTDNQEVQKPFDIRAGKAQSQSDLEEAHWKVRAAYIQAIMTDTHGNRFAATESRPFVSVIFAEHELRTDDEGITTFGLPKHLPYSNDYITSVGNSPKAVGNHSVIRVLDARYGYGQMIINHTFVTDSGNQYEFATTWLSVLHSEIDENFYGYATKKPGSDKRNPHVTKGYAELGLHLSEQDLEGIDLDNVLAYKMSVTVDGQGVRHAINSEVMTKMKSMKLGGHEEAVEAVDNMFSKREKTRFTFFCPGLDRQCAKALLSFSNSRVRAEDNPYGGLFNKVPSTKYFTNINQLADLSELHVQVQENAVVYFDNIDEFTARFSCGSRDEHTWSEAVSALLETREQQGIYIPIPYAQVQGRDSAGLIGLPKPVLIDALPRMDEVCEVVPGLTHKTEIPPAFKPDKSEKIYWLTKTLAKFWQEAKANGADQKAKMAIFRETMHDILIPAQTVEQTRKRDGYLDALAKHLMPKFENNQRESPADHRARLEAYATDSVHYFQHLEKEVDEAPRVVCRRIAVPQWLANWASHWYYAVNPRQRNWPKDSPVEAPLVDIAWPRISLEKGQHYTNQQVRKALATKTFPLRIIRACYDDTVVAQLGGIATATREHTEETPFGSFVDWCLRFGDCNDKRDPAEFFPRRPTSEIALPEKTLSLAQEAPAQITPESKGDDDEPAPQTLQSFESGALLGEILEEDMRIIEDATSSPRISKEASDRMIQAYRKLSGEQQQVFLKKDMPFGTLLCNGCPGSGKSAVALDFGLDMQSTTIDESRVKELVAKPPFKSKKSNPDKLCHDTTEKLLADRFKLNTADMVQTTYQDAEGYDKRGKFLTKAKTVKPVAATAPVLSTETTQTQVTTTESTATWATENVAGTTEEINWGSGGTYGFEQDKPKAGPSWRKSTFVISADTNEQLDDLAAKAAIRGYNINGRRLLITRVTNPNASKGDLESLVNGHKDIFDVITEPDLDETTAKFMLYHVGQKARDRSRRKIKGGDYNVGSHMFAYVEEAKNGNVIVPEARIIHNLLEKRERAPATFTKDDARDLKKNLNRLELQIINQSDVILGTPVALSKLSRRKGLDIFVSCIFIDEAYRMTEPNTWTVLSAFKDAPFRILAGDLKQLGPLVLTSRSDHDLSSETYFTGVFSKQLALPLASRMERGGVQPVTLRINHRSCGGASDFCSQMFYYGAMVESQHNSCQEEIERCTDIMRSLAQRNLRGSMLNFDLVESEEIATGSSFINPMHAQYIAEIVFRLHYQNAPGQLDRDLGLGKRATIHIAAFYSEQVPVIINALARLPKQVCWRDGIKVTTADGAIGHEADIVILDPVRSSKLGFTGDHKRVNVAYTRARLLNITVLNSNSVSTRDYMVRDSGKNIVVAQRKYAKARNAHVQVKRDDTVFCQKCFGKAHKKSNTCPNEVYCSHCNLNTHHIRKCNFADKGLDEYVPLDSTIAAPGSVRALKNIKSSLAS